MNDVRAKAWETRRKKYGAHGHAMAAYGRADRPISIGSLRDHLEHALTCLMDEFNAAPNRSGPSGLRAQAITHVRYALLLLPGQDGA